MKESIPKVLSDTRAIGWWSLAAEAWTTAESKGWHEVTEEHPARTVSEVVMLLHSEVTEAGNEWRNGHQVNELYMEGDKPEGFLVELADIVIRIAEYVEDLHLTPKFLEALESKLAYNTTRPHRHGNKRV